MKLTPVLIALSVYLFASVAIAQAEATGYPAVDQVLVWIGVASVIAAALATALPKEWRITQILARFGSDTRNLRPAPKKEDK